MLYPLAEQLGLMKAVEFLGYVGEGELSDLYENAVALIFMSRYEGFGLPALEAMAAGCPVIVSDRASLPEVVNDFGFVVGLDDWKAAAEYVTKLVARPDWASSIQKRGVDYASRWTWTEMVDRTLDIYHEVIRATPVPSERSVAVNY